LTVSEKRWAKSRFEDYRNHYHMESFSDLQLLEELVFREALQERYKKKIGKLAKPTKKEKSEKEDTKNKPKVVAEVVPKYLLKALDENLDKILIIKEKLGLFEEKKENDFNAFQILDKKFKIWKENRGAKRACNFSFFQMIFFPNIKFLFYNFMSFVCIVFFLSKKS